MIERRGHRRFAQQMRARIGRGQRGIGDALERDSPPEARILGQVDDAHPAGARRSTIRYGPTLDCTSESIRPGQIEVDRVDQVERVGCRVTASEGAR